ncbi:MAG: sigma-70 family RNA polymerase sigma factor [Firmicutes bacterium]|nr:sigma-70 family RNA polymerase sigma factor [Bacillota bacterium]
MIGYKELRDEEIVILAKKGDEAALSEVFERYKTVVRVKAKSYFIAGGDPDDTIQEGMIGLFQAVRDFDENKGAAFNTFAQLCIDRQIMTAIKKAASKKNSPLNTSVPIPETEDGETAEHAESPENILVDRENAETIRIQLKDSLSSFENRVFDILLNDRNYAEIAEIMGVDKKSVDNAIQRIKRKMKMLQGE